VVDNRTIEWRKKSLVIDGLEISFSELSDCYWKMVEKLHKPGKKIRKREEEEEETGLPWLED